MKVISTICGLIAIGLIVALPIFLFKLVKKYILTKEIDRELIIKVGGCLGGIVVFTIVGTLTSPTTWCEHEYVVVEDVAPTCTEKGKLIRKCSLCDLTSNDYPDMLGHSWVNGAVINATCTERGKVETKCTICDATSISYTDMLPHSWNVEYRVESTCTSGGYTSQKCSLCSVVEKTNIINALGHSLKESSRTEPTYENKGSIVKKCARCEYEEVEILERLERMKIKFNKMELVFGDYSFTEVDNRFSEFNGKIVVKIPVTITNLSNEPNELYFSYYKLFGTSGVETPITLCYYFDDDVSDVGSLLPNKSCVAYFHILYDGDGIYTITFDDYLFDKKMVEIPIKID